MSYEKALTELAFIAYPNNDTSMDTDSFRKAILQNVKADMENIIATEFGIWCHADDHMELDGLIGDVISNLREEDEEDDY